MASIAKGIEGLIWKGLPEALHREGETRTTVPVVRDDASVVTHYFHNMHAMALGGTDNFHPIAACTMASMMALAACFFVRMVESFVPRAIRSEFTLIAKGAPCVYAASIIAFAAHQYTTATQGNPLKAKKEEPHKE